jgi:hypothetical protein
VWLFRYMQARLLGAEFLIQLRAGRCRLVYGLMSAKQREDLEQTCSMHNATEGWILILPSAQGVRVKGYGDVQRIEQALLNTIYLV